MRSRERAARAFRRGRVGNQGRKCFRGEHTSNAPAQSGRIRTETVQLNATDVTHCREDETLEDEK